MSKENYKLFVVGMNHNTSTISEREKFQINKKEISAALKYFIARKEVEGIIIISTCNRLEFYMVLKKNTDPFSLVKEFYFDKRKIEAGSKRSLFYIY